MPCPDENQLAEYVGGTLLARDQRAIDEHVDGCPACRRLLAAFAAGEPSIGDAIADRYELRAIAGTGAMSIVYAAHDRLLDRMVALKLVRDRDAERRLAREARVMAQLVHPNILPVYDVGTLDGRLYLTCELVPGSSLAAWLAAAPRPWPTVVRVFLDAARGLAAAHAAGVIHRDIKPGNILIADTGRVLVADFGLARRTSLSTVLTATGAAVGTPAYMAPEQLRAEPADPRSDQFAFCVSLFEALHGTRPFAADSPAALHRAILAGDLAPPRRDIPPAVADIIARGLAADPAARWPSITDLATALDATLAPARPRRPLLRISLASTAVALVLVAAGTPLAGSSGKRTETRSGPIIAGARVGSDKAIASDNRTASSKSSASGKRTESGSDLIIAGAAVDRRVALLRLIATLGYRGVDATDVGAVRAQRAALRPDDLGDAVRLDVEIGALERKRGDCRSALVAFGSAEVAGKRIMDAAAAAHRAPDRGFLIWYRRAAFGRALCLVVQGDADAVPTLRMANAWLAETEDAIEAQSAYGAVLFAAGDGDAKRYYVAGRDNPAVIAWAHAVGAPLE